MEEVVCKNCGNVFEGNFCNSCGEKVQNDHEKSVKHLAEEAFHFITHFDSKFLRTLKSVLLYTGRYSLEYTQGARKKYFKPISLFLIVIIAYLLFPFFSGLNMKFNTYMQPKYGYTFVSHPVVKAKLESMSYADIQKQYDEKSSKASKFLLLLYLPLSALVLQLLFFRQKKFYYDHFILATELNTFFIFTVYLLLPLLMFALVLLAPVTQDYFHDNGLVFRSIYVLFMAVAGLAFRRFYKEPWMWSFVKGIAFMFVYNFGIKFVYSIVLFLLVMLFVH